MTKITLKDPQIVHHENPKINELLCGGDQSYFSLYDQKELYISGSKVDGLFAKIGESIFDIEHSEFITEDHIQRYLKTGYLY